MRTLRNLLVYTNVWIALAASLLTLANAVVIKVPVESVFSLAAFVFLATASAYTFLRLIGLREKHEQAQSEFMDWVRKYKSPLILWTGITAAAALYFFFQLNFARQLVLASSMLVSVLYGIPCIPFKGKLRPLRQLPYIKTILVAITWMLTTAVSVYADRWPIQVRPQDILLCLFVFTFIIGLTIPFDIRDANWDKEIELPTLAHLLGVKRTRQLALATLILYLIIGFGLFVFLPCYINYPAFFRSYYLAAYVGVLFGGIGAFIIVQKIDENSPDHYFTFRIDGMIIIQSIAIILILSLDRWM